MGMDICTEAERGGQEHWGPRWDSACILQDWKVSFSSECLTRHCSHLPFPTLSAAVLSAALGCTAISSSQQILEQNECCCCRLLACLLTALRCLRAGSFTQHFPC